MDTGPLVAYFDERDAYHDWAIETFSSLDLPAITCEAVLTETCFLVARTRQSAVRVLDRVLRKEIRLGLSLREELAAVRALMDRYANVPMSLADACLVRLAEMTGLPICTLDSDFKIYRARGRRNLALITPSAPRFLHEP
jgi:predicted nucleic acid-binding protein